MALENKLGLTSSADLAREEERIAYLLFSVDEYVMNETFERYRSNQNRNTN